MPLELLKTGIKGLDEMLGGGIPKGRTIIVSGGPGTGKTTLAMEFLYRGALKNESGLFFSLEESPQKLYELISKSFTWKKFPEFIKNKTIQILRIENYDYRYLMDLLQESVCEKNIERIAIDSGTVLRLFFKDDFEFRRRILNILDFLGKFKSTTLMTHEFPSSERRDIRFSIEHFVVDGIIMLYNLQQKFNRVRGLEIIKMRGMNHSNKIVPMNITSSGIEVFPEEQILYEE